MFIGFPATVAIECFERVFLKDLPTDWSFTDIGLLDDVFFSVPEGPEGTEKMSLRLPQ